MSDEQPTATVDGARNGVASFAPKDWSDRGRYVAAVLFLMMCSFVLVRTARDALYMQGGGLFALPKAYLSIALLSIPAAGLMLGSMRLFGARRARVLTSALFAVVLLVYARVARAEASMAMDFFFVLVPLAYGVLFSAAWLLGADLLDQAPRNLLARAYGTMGAAALLGGTTGGLVARLLASQVDARVLIGVGAVLLGAASALLAGAQRRFPPRVIQGFRPPPRPGARSLLSTARTPYVLGLFAIAAVSALVGTLVEFQFFLAAATTKGSTADTTRFFANLYLLLNAVGFLVQVRAVPWLQRRIGMHGSLLILPSAVLGVTAFLAASAGFALRSLLRLTEGTIKSTVHRSSWEQTYHALPIWQRGLAKLFVDGGGARLGEATAALAIQAWLLKADQNGGLERASTTWLGWTLFAAAAGWILLTMSLWKSIHSCMAGRSAADLRADIPIPDS